MPFTFAQTKPFLLMIAISIGAMLCSERAMAAERDTFVVAGGCFWCVESDFESVDGVISAVSGFTGGTVKNPSYKQVVRGGTGHFEAVEITFDPAKVSYETLLNLFFRSIDPTDDGGQFCDRGATYRTAIFVPDDEKRALAEDASKEAQAALGKKIVTQILPETAFYKAGGYHQDYYKQTKIVVTRFGPITKAKAYKRYREGCGRDKRITQLWGSDAPFVADH